MTDVLLKTPGSDTPFCPRVAVFVRMTGAEVRRREVAADCNVIHTAVETVARDRGVEWDYSRSTCPLV